MNIKENDKKVSRAGILMVALVLIKGILVFVSGSVCTFTFYQPSEPEKIKNIYRERK